MSPCEEFQETMRRTEFALRCVGIKLRLCEELPPGGGRTRYAGAMTTVLLFISLSLVWLVERIRDGIDLDEFTDFVPKLIICTIAVVKIVFVRLNEDSIVRLIWRLRDLYVIDRGYIADDPILDADVRSALKLLNFVIKLVTNIGSVTFVAFMCSPFFMTAYYYRTTGEWRLYWPYPLSYVFWDANDARVWLVAYLHTALSGSTVVLYAVGSDTLVYAYCTYIHVQFRVLCARLRGDYELSQAARRHQELIQLVRGLDIVTCKSTLYFFVASTFLICFCGFVVTLMKETMLAFLLLLLMSLSQIFMYNYFGDMICKSSEAVSVAVYECGWHLDPLLTATGHSVLLMLVRSQHPCMLTAYKFGVVGLYSFTKVLSSSWSYFALLRTLYHHK